MTKLQNKAIFVSGGTRGIGRQLVIQSLQRGAKQVITTGRAALSIEKAKQDFGDNDKITWLACDFSKSADRTKLLADLKEISIDGVIHNAGISVLRECWKPKHARKEETERVASAEEETMVNFLAPVQLTEQLLDGLSEKQDAFICFITSGLAMAPKKSSPIYCASKAALRSYAKSLRATLQTCAPSVTIIDALPPPVATEMTQGRGDDDADKITPESCAKAILDGIEGGKTEICIGKSNALKWIIRILPEWGESLVINK